MSIYSHLIETICFLGFLTGTRYQKLNSPFVIKFVILFVLSLTVTRSARGQEISPAATKDFYAFTPMVIEGNTLSDSLFNNRGVKEIHSFNVLFESVWKQNGMIINDQNIRTLEQQAKIEHANLKQVTLKQSITTACTAFLIIVVGLVYVHYCRKKKDNSIIKEQNKELQRLIEEKEWLVKEIHHRVTNNLHIVISLLESQAMFLRDDALKAIKISQHRIYADYFLIIFAASRAGEGAACI